MAAPSTRSSSSVASSMLMMSMASAAIFLLLAFPGMAAAAPPKNRLTQFEYYLHLDQQLGTVATSNSGQTSDLRYSTMVFDLPMTEGISRSSKSLGVVRGLSVIGTGSAYPAAAGRRLEVLLNTILYDDGVYSGEISQHGVYDLSLVYGSSGGEGSVGGSGREMAVVGGTGDFRCVNGFSTVSLATQSPHTVLKWTVNLYYTCPPPAASS